MRTLPHVQEPGVTARIPAFPPTLPYTDTCFPPGETEWDREEWARGRDLEFFVWSSGTAELHIKWKCLCKTENPAVLLLGLSVPGPPSDSLGPLLPEPLLLQFPSSSSSPLKASPPQCLREDKPPSAPPLPGWGSPL